jgi:hypothetical protein
MSNQHMPTTEVVRYTYVRLMHTFLSDSGEGFDRWLADHDREIASKAWREGHSAGEYDRLLDNIDISPNPYEIEES